MNQHQDVGDSTAVTGDLLAFVRQLDRPPGHIVVEGPIGVGKSILAKRLAAIFGHDTLLENSGVNPFLERFYREGKPYALPTQLFFLLHRADQLKQLRQDDLFQVQVVTDFLLEKDQLFAELTLDEHELHLYRQVYTQLAVATVPPDLVIYLQAPADVLQARIRSRGIPAEQDIDADYLERLNEAYASFFHFYDEAPLLIVNAADVDLVNDDVCFTQLLTQVCQFDGRRQYFNPQPTLL